MTGPSPDPTPLDALRSLAAHLPGEIESTVERLVGDPESSALIEELQRHTSANQDSEGAREAIAQVQVQMLRLALPRMVDDFAALHRGVEGISELPLIEQIPPPGGIAGGMNAPLAAAFGFLPPGVAQEVCELEIGMTPRMLARIGREMPNLDPEDLTDTSPLTWWLAVRSLTREEGVDASGFIAQVVALKELVENPSRRREAARDELHAMLLSNSTIAQLGKDVPFGERRGSTEAAFMLGHPFAVRYDPATRHYSVATLREPGHPPAEEIFTSFEEVTERVGELRRHFATRLTAVERPQKFSEVLWDLIERAVERTTPSRLHDLAEKERGTLYRGDQRVLLKFLLAMGTFDPYEARRRAMWILPPARQVPGHVAAGEVGAISASGQHLVTGEIFAATSRDRSFSHVMYCGRQAFLSICREWPTEVEVLSDSSAPKRAQRARVAALALPTVQYSLLFPPEEAPRQLPPLETPLMRRRREYSEVLGQAIDRARATLGHLAERGELVILAGDAEGDVLAGQSGHTLLGRLRELATREEQEGGLSDEARAKYFELASAELPKSDERIKELLSDLMLEVALRDLVRKDVAFAAWKSDIDVLLGDEGLRAEFDPRGLLARNMIEIQRALEGDSRYIEQLGVGSVMALFPVTGVRRALNERHLEKRGGIEPLRRAATALKPLFLNEDGSWQPDALREGVPLGRIRERVEGRVLNRNELLQIKRFFYLLTGSFAPSHLFTNAAHRDFVTVVDATLKAFSKLENVRHLVDGLVFEGAGPLRGATLDFSTMTPQLEAAFERLGKRVPREPQGEERFRLVSDFPLGRPALEMLMERASSREDYLLEGWRTEGSMRVMPALRAGIYPVDIEERLVRWYQQVRSWVPRADIPKIVNGQSLDETLAFIGSSPLVLEIPRRDRPFFTEVEVRELVTVAEHLNTVRMNEGELFHQVRDRSREDLRREVERARFGEEGLPYDEPFYFQGFLKESSGAPSQLVLYSRPFIKLVQQCDHVPTGQSREKNAFISDSRLRIFRPELLVRALNLVERDFVAPTPEWIARVETVRKELSLRPRHHHLELTPPAYQTLEDIVRGRGQRSIMVRRSLVDLIDSLYKKVTPPEAKDRER